MKWDGKMLRGLGSMGIRFSVFPFLRGGLGGRGGWILEGEGTQAGRAESRS
jgi:hypothetical protein